MRVVVVERKCCPPAPVPVPVTLARVVHHRCIYMFTSFCLLYPPSHFLIKEIIISPGDGTHKSSHNNYHPYYLPNLQVGKMEMIKDSDL